MYNAEGPTYTTVYGAATAQWTTASVSKNTVSGEVFWGFGTCTLHCRRPDGGGRPPPRVHCGRRHSRQAAWLKVSVTALFDPYWVS